MLSEVQKIMLDRKHLRPLEEGNMKIEVFSSQRLLTSKEERERRVGFYIKKQPRRNISIYLQFTKNEHACTEQKIENTPLFSQSSPHFYSDYTN